MSALDSYIFRSLSRPHKLTDRRPLTTLRLRKEEFNILALCDAHRLYSIRTCLGDFQKYIYKSDTPPLMDNKALLFRKYYALPLFSGWPWASKIPDPKIVQFCDIIIFCTLLNVKLTTMMMMKKVKHVTHEHHILRSAPLSSLSRGVFVSYFCICTLYYIVLHVLCLCLTPVYLRKQSKPNGLPEPHDDYVECGHHCN